jgi:hypothetical protein
MIKLRTTIFLAAIACGSLLVGCGAGDSGSLADDTGTPVSDSGGGDTNNNTDTGSNKDTGPGTDTGPTTDTGPGTDTGPTTDSGSGDTGTDTGTVVIPDGAVAAAPVAGAVVASDSKYKLITQTTQGGSKGPMSSSKYNLHGGSVTVIPK